MREAFRPDELVRLGSKRGWVPMGLWLFLFYTTLYEVWPISWLAYERAK